VNAPESLTAYGAERRRTWALRHAAGRILTPLPDPLSEAVNGFYVMVPTALLIELRTALKAAHEPREGL